MSQDKEREAFEAWLRSMPEGDQINLDPMPGANGRSYSTFATYRDREVETMWLAWQARAALASQQAGKGEPIGWASDDGRVVSAELVKRYPEYRIGYNTPLFAHPPSREPLTELLIEAEFGSDSNESYPDFLAGVRFAERAHGIHSREGGSK